MCLRLAAKSSMQNRARRAGSCSIGKKSQQRKTIGKRRKSEKVWASKLFEPPEGYKPVKRSHVGPWPKKRANRG